MQAETSSQLDIQLEEPKQYKVLLLNDNYTTMDFVVEILMLVFKKNTQDATNIMLDIHHNGSGVCGIYPYEIALTKTKQVEFYAKKANFPLKAIMEEE